LASGAIEFDIAATFPMDQVADALDQLERPSAVVESWRTSSRLHLAPR
jgi:hypothetical protein